MTRVETDKKINPTQLGIELGRVPLRVSQGRYVEADAVTQADLAAAIAAHRADDSYKDPQHNPPPDAQVEFDKALAAAAAKPTVDEKLAALFAALQGVGLPGKAAVRTAR